MNTQPQHFSLGRIWNWIPLAAFALALASVPIPRAEADPYVPVEGKLENRALLFELEKGTRRARMQVRDPDTGIWSTYSIAHLRGDEMFFKVRIPDDVAAEDCRVQTSKTDPFPYSYYKGRTTYSEQEGSSSPTSNFGGGSLSVLDAGFADDVDRSAAGIASAEFSGGTTPVAPVADEVVESDIWQWRGRTLYFFNQLRGLQVIDANDAANPRKVATLRMPAAGDQMYVLDDEHLLLLTRRWSYHWAWGSSRDSEVILVRHRGDELEVLNRYPLDGTFMESRLVGRRLYTVSRVRREMGQEDGGFEWRNTLEVRSLDLSDPDSPTALPPLTLSNPSSSYFWDAVVTASPNYFFVAPRYYDNATNETRSRVLAIPIGSGVTALEVSHEVDLKSHLADKFKLRERDNILIAISQSNRRWGETLKTYIESFDLSRQDAKLPMDTLEIAPRERLHATRFQGDRLYVVTFLVPVRIDPLFVIDVSNPTDMQVQGELEVPGWANYLEPIANDQVLAVGVEEDKVAVSLYDASDPANPTQLSRVFPGEGRTTTEANFDEKAFNYLASEGLALLPVESRKEDGTRESRMHLIDVTSRGLIERGSIPHEFKGRRATAFADTVLSLSQHKLLAVDISDRDNPRVESYLPLAWNVDRIIEFDGYAIHVQSGARNSYYTRHWSLYDLNNSLGRVHVTLATDPEVVIADLTLPRGEVIGTVLSGETLFLAVIHQFREEYQNEEGQTRTRWANDFRTVAIDLADPEDPAISDVEDFRYSDGYHYRYSELDGAVLPSGALLWYPHVENNNHSSGWGWNYWGYDYYADVSFLGAARYLGPVYSFVSELETFAYDVNDVSDLRFLSRTRVAPENLSRIGKAFLHGNDLMVSYKASTYDSETRQQQNQYFVQELSFDEPATPQLSAAVNVPGILEGTLQTEEDQFVLFTSTPKFRGRTHWSFQTSNGLLQASIYDGEKAFLVREISVEDGRYTPTVVSGEFLFKSYWDGEFEGLIVFAWSSEEGTFAEAGRIDLGHVPEALHLSGGILFAQSGGLLSVVPLEALFDAERQLTTDWPAYRYATWLHRLRVGPDRKVAWIPAGTYGVETIDLSGLGLDASPAPLPVNWAGWSELAADRTMMVTATGTDAAGVLSAGSEYAVGAPLNMRLEQWRLAHFNPTNDPQVVMPPLAIDSDRDGFTDLQEFLFASEPTSAASRPTGPTWRQGDDQLEFVYRLSAAAAEDVHLRLFTSPDMRGWESLPESRWTAIWGDDGFVELVLTPSAERGASFVKIGVDPR